MTNEARLAAEAIEILQENDRGTYTVPTSDSWPFQWNWDSCLTALGQWHFDESRAWTEIETLFAHQWPDGMVPHIVFHGENSGYPAGPGLWDTGRPVPTSGITQPPTAGFALRRLWQRSRNREILEPRLRELVPKVAAWHRWFFAHRDPRDEGLVAILHPWEAGRDDSIDWDEALERVAGQAGLPDPRQNAPDGDTAATHDRERDLYLWLAGHLRDLGWDNPGLHDAAPFRMVDPGLNAILFRSCADLATLAARLELTEIAEENTAFVERGLKALEELWSPPEGQYLAFDRVADMPVDSASVGGLMPVFADIPLSRVSCIAGTIDRLAGRARHIVPSHDPADPRYDARDHWRGPVWLVVNYLVADGLRRAGSESIAARIVASSLDLIRENGLAESYDPGTGAPLGGTRFSWTAAMALEFLDLTDVD